MTLYFVGGQFVICRQITSQRQITDQRASSLQALVFGPSSAKARSQKHEISARTSCLEKNVKMLIYNTRWLYHMWCLCWLYACPQILIQYFVLNSELHFIILNEDEHQDHPNPTQAGWQPPLSCVNREVGFSSEVGGGFRFQAPLFTPEISFTRCKLATPVFVINSLLSLDSERKCCCWPLYVCSDEGQVRICAGHHVGFVACHRPWFVQPTTVDFSPLQQHISLGLWFLRTDQSWLLLWSSEMWFYHTLWYLIERSQMNSKR